jgi:hypothetical protein
MRAGEAANPLSIAFVTTPEIVSGFIQACMFPAQNFRIKSSAPKLVTSGQPYCEHLTDHLNDLVNGRRG